MILKSMLQDMTLWIALVLVMFWTGNQPATGFGWVFIMLFTLLITLKNYREGVRFGRAHSAFLTPEQYDEWLKSHGINPQKVAESKATHEGH